MFGWISRSARWAWDKATFKGTRTAILEVITDEKDTKTPVRFWWMIASLSFVGFTGFALLLKSQPFDAWGYAKGIALINGSAAVGLWFGKEREAPSWPPFGGGFGGGGDYSPRSDLYGPGGPGEGA